MDEISCADLKAELNQLAIVLYPVEHFNEKFLIKMRDCVLKLSEDHPLKQWLKAVASPTVPAKAEQEKASFLREITSSQFNLITDQKTKTKIIEVISVLPDETLFEKLLKSQLYLIIGNVTRSDKILKSIFQAPPLTNWEGFTARPSIYHRTARDHLQLILERLGRHPADRKAFHLFCLYISNYFNDPSLLELVAEHEPESLAHRMSLSYTESLSQEFVRFLRLKRMRPAEQARKLRRSKEFPLPMQAYWVWPFLDLVPQVSPELVDELKAVHEKDLLWFYYLMDDEKLADTYTKKSAKSFLPGRRQFLRGELQNEKHFMLALYKLIEIGDIDADLVKKTVHFLRHD